MKKPEITCRCWIGLAAFCSREARFVAGRKKGFPLPVCTQHAKKFRDKPGVTVLAL